MVRKTPRILAILILIIQSSLACTIPPMLPGQNGHRVEYCPSWSPDGKTIAFADWVPVSENDYREAIFVMNHDGSNVVQLTDSSASSYNPVWSPDGETIAFVSIHNYEIYVIRNDGSQLRQVTNCGREGNLCLKPNWSPDGQEIAFEAHYSHDGVTDAWSIRVIDVDGPNPIELTGETTRGIVGNPVWAPDGHRIAFVDWDSGIVAATPDGSSLTLLTVRTGIDLAWSPDGERLAFASDGDICVLTVDNAHLACVDSEDAYGPSWSPDGRQIVYWTYRDGNIYVMSADGSAVVHVADGYFPDWSPDGTRIAFQSHNGLATITPDGADYACLWDCSESP